MTDWKILHCFADEGVESEALSAYGDVCRIGLDPRDRNDSQPIQADAKHLPLRDDVTFDFGLFHPPCTKWSTMPSADTEKAENLIPVAREIAQSYCSDWIIENRPNAPLDDPLYLTGHMFNLPIEYERGFETSFEVEQPRKQSKLAETSPFFYSNRSKMWWASVKQCSTRYGKQHIAKNTIPKAYIRYIMQWYAKSIDYHDRDECVDREKYSGYDKEMDKRRNQKKNAQLTEYK